MKPTLATLLRAVHQGIRLGGMDSDALRRLTARAYSEMPLYQSREYNLGGLARWENEALDRSFSTCRSVLLAASGGGREVVGLCRRGLRVDAFECCPCLVAQSRDLLDAERIPARVVQSKPDRVPNDLGTYDGLIVGWGAYMHIVGRSSRIRFLQELHRHVPFGGPLLLSFFRRDDQDRLFRVTNRVARLIRRAREPVEVGDTISNTFDHHFTRPEVDAELCEAGFRLIHLWRYRAGIRLG